MSTSRQWWALLLAVFTWGLPSQFLDRVCAQSAERDLVQAESLLRGGALRAAAEIFARVKDETPSESTPELDRRRRLCLSRLISIHRRMGDHKSALQFALTDRDLLRSHFWPEVNEELQRNAMLIADCQQALGDYPAAEATLQEALQGRCGSVKNFLKFHLLVELAVVCRLQDRADDSLRYWREASVLGDNLWTRFRNSLSAEASVTLLQRWLECQEALGDEGSAQEVLKTLLNRAPVNLPNRPSWVTTILLEQAKRALLRNDFVHAKQHLQEVLRRTQTDEPSRLRAQAHWQLAQILIREGRTTLAREEQSRAADQFEKFLSSPQLNVETLLADLRQLRGLYVSLDRADKAVEIGERLLSRQTAELGADHSQTIESLTLLGSQYGALGEPVKARQRLEHAVSLLRRMDNSTRQLAQALSELGEVERNVSEFDEAAEHFRQAIVIHERNPSVEPMDLAKSYNNLANVYLAQAKFSDAIQRYQQALAHCSQRGRREDAMRSFTLLNLGAASKSQGQWESAEKYYQESLALLEAIEGPNSVAAAGHYNAMATLDRTRGRLPEAKVWAQKTITACEADPQNPRANSAIAAARIQLGMIACVEKNHELAAEHWQNALETHKKSRQIAQIPNTLNLLGVLSYQQQDYDKAQALLEEAASAQQNFDCTPQERYNTLCNLAAVYYRQHREKEAFSLLEQATSIPNTMRVDTFGEAELGRAKFLAQFASAYEMLVQWHLEAGDLNAAFLAAEQCRNRTFLDQLRLAGVDLNSSLPEEAKAREREQRLKLHRLRQQVRRSSEQSEDVSDSASLKMELRAAEAAYARLFNELRDSSPVYRQLLADDQQVVGIEDLRRILAADTLCLFYHLGSHRSDVLVIGGDQVPVVRVSLEVTPQQAARLPELPWLHGTNMELVKRGIAGVQEVPKRSLKEPISVAPAVVAGPVTRPHVAEMVTWYRQALSQRRLGADRGIGAVVQTAKGEPVADGAFTLLSDILFPIPVRQEIQRRRPRLVVVIPDGALHNLPFEALVLATAPEPRYVLDEFPPFAYVPSASILSNLRRRETLAEPLRHLLTVAPRYGGSSPIAATQDAKSSVQVAASELTRDSFDGLTGPLPELQGARHECERLESLFSQRGLQVSSLLDQKATESRFTAAVSGHKIIHLAAHGLVDEQYGNLFGRIALTHSADDTGDGFLMYNEILQLKLRGCELAVLSACQTNVGPNRPLEAGSTLAQAFLAAGARRVVASQWSVSDASTTELVTTFLESVADVLRANRAPSYADALHQAKLEVRRDKRWAAPYFWAPFVLLGPNE